MMWISEAASCRSACPRAALVHTSRVHGRKREDLDGMLLALGLNAGNPVCVMTQDTARNFLAGSSSKVSARLGRPASAAAAAQAVPARCTAPRRQAAAGLNR